MSEVVRYDWEQFTDDCERIAARRGWGCSVQEGVFTGWGWYFTVTLWTHIGAYDVSFDDEEAQRLRRVTPRVAALAKAIDGGKGLARFRRVAFGEGGDG